MNHRSRMSAPPPQNGIATWDPNMAAENAVVDEAGVNWIDGKDLPIEGRVFDDDSEGTVDGYHPNDYGMVSLSKAYGAAVSEALAAGNGG